jgi:4-hydroxyacetophenone monooxygenase
MVPHFPNMFMLYGPNSQPLSGGTGSGVVRDLGAYAAQLLVRMIEEGKTRVDVKESAYLRYNEALDEEASKLLLLERAGAPDKNYYVNEFGRLQMNAPWYGPEFHRMCTERRLGRPRARLSLAQRGSRHIAVTVGAPLPTGISPVVSKPCRA